MVAVAIGKIDAFLFVAGALLGMFFYGEVYPIIENFTKSGFLGSVTLSDWLDLSPGVIALLVILMALGMFWGAEILESKFAEKESVIEGEQDNTLEKVSDTV